MQGEVRGQEGRGAVSKLLVLAALPVIVLVLAACGGEKAGPTPGTPGATPSTGPVQIEIWHSEPAANEETLKGMIDRFNASQDEVRVTPVYQGSPEDLMTKLMASTGSGRVPAIAEMMESYIQRLIDSGFVTPVQDFVDRENYDLSDLDERAVQSYTVEGKLWGVPFCVDIPLLYYNKLVFKEVGLDPERPPQTLEELRQYSQEILKRDASGNVERSGVSIAVTLWTEQIFAQQGDLLVDMNNGHDGRATKVLFDDDTGRRFFQWWYDMVDEGLAFNVGRNPGGADNYLAVASGRAAMTFGYAGALRSLVSALEKGVEGVEIGVGPMPGFADGTGSTLLLPHGLWILNLRPQEEQEAAWKFIKWFMEPEQQAEWFAGSGQLPVSRSSVELPTAQGVVAQYPLFETALEQYMGVPANPASLGVILGPFPEVREAMAVGVEEMLVGGKDPIGALEDAAQRANQAIEKYNEQVK
jgi:sn-glycerol 3-phosphate transport system substrate-binding protein